MPKRAPASEVRHQRDVKAFMERMQEHLRISAAGGHAPDIRPSAIAAATGYDRTSISKILSGARLPTYEQMAQLGEYLGLPASPREPATAAGPTRAVLPLHSQVGTTALVGSDAGDLSDRAIATANPALADYLKRREAERDITPRERFYLANTRVQLEPWIVVDDRFWDRLLAFWRGYLAEMNASPKVNQSGLAALEALTEVAHDTFEEAGRALRSAADRVVADLRSGRIDKSAADARMAKIAAEGQELAKFIESIVHDPERTDAPPARKARSHSKRRRLDG